MRFFIPARLRTKGNRMKIYRRGRRTWIGPTDEQKAAQREVAIKALPHAPRKPLDGPVRLDVTVVVPIPPSYKGEKLRKAQAGEIYPDTPDKGDRGNHLKLLEDALEDAGFYDNDARICAGEVGKVFGSVSGYQINLEALA